MFHTVSHDPIDYLVIGHITVDLTPTGPKIGGSVSYAALTARAMGLRVGIVTAWGHEIPLGSLEGIPIVSQPALSSTTFENVYTPAGRVQYIRAIAPKIEFDSIPRAWRSAKIIHLAPVAQEVEAVVPQGFTPELVGLSPQGWFRAWDENGRVRPCPWAAMDAALSHSTAVILSVEDIARDEDLVDHMAQEANLLVVTEGPEGARLFWHGDTRRFRPPNVTEVDPTGAGDVFSASFFTRLLATHDPWEAARFANRVASISVTRFGLDGVPTPDEANACLVEILD